MSEPSGTGERTPDCTIRFEGEEVPAVAGEPVAVALFASEKRVLSRSAKYHRPRSFFCLAGHCGSCLMRVDGVPNVKACLAPAHEGQVVERQNAFPSGSFDVLGAADFFFPRGMDHHTMMTSSTALNALMRRVVREVGGLGLLPDESPDAATLPRARRADVDVAIVGGGPAGLAAAVACAQALRERGRAPSILLVDEGDRPGGSLLSHPRHGVAEADALAAAARALGVDLRHHAAAVGYYPEDDGGLLAVDEAGTLLRVHARRTLYANGGYDTNALFGDNDRPGICAARAVGTLLVRHHVVPGRRPLVLGEGEYADALAGALSSACLPVERVDGVRVRPVSSRGHAWVGALEVEEDGKRRKIACDLVAVARPPAPASELARQHGVTVRLSPEGGGFGCVVDADGRTDVPGVFAAGDVCGFVGVDEARRRGERAGRAIAASLGEG